jgi:hypothetical protein
MWRPASRCGIERPRDPSCDLAGDFSSSPTWERRPIVGARRQQRRSPLRRCDERAGALAGREPRRRVAAYDEALLAREAALFPEWYIGRHLGVELSAGQRETFEALVKRVIARNLAEPRVFVHRDFMPRNLMVCEPNPGILDFQDAVHGPISYDVACLYRDAFVSWDEERVLDGTIRYWEKAARRGFRCAAISPNSGKTSSGWACSAT